MRLWTHIHRLLVRDVVGTTVPGWTPLRAREAEAATHRYLGRLEPHFAWSFRFRRSKLRAVKFQQRKSA